MGRRILKAMLPAEPSVAEARVSSILKGSVTYWRVCEFCGCKTNAVERICCAHGSRLDRNTWDRSSLDWAQEPA